MRASCSPQSGWQHKPRGREAQDRIRKAVATEMGSQMLYDYEKRAWSLANFLTFPASDFHLDCAFMKRSSLVPIERIEKAIYLIRGEKVMLDRDLAVLYGVSTKAFNQAIKRHKERFPPDFRFQLTMEEARALRSEVTPNPLRSQAVTLKRGQHLKYRPYAFTEHGILMLSSVLNSERAVQVNIEIMRAFVKLREMLASNALLSRRLDELEGKYNRQFRVVFDAIRELMSPSAPARKQIGFRSRR